MSALNQLGASAELLGLGVVVLVAIVVALLLVGVVQIGLWIALSKLTRRLDRYAAPRPRSPRNDA